MQHMYRHHMHYNFICKKQFVICGEANLNLDQRILRGETMSFLESEPFSDMRVYGLI